MSIRVLTTPGEQSDAMAAGTRRLLLLTTPSPVRALAGRLGTRAKLVLASYPYAPVAELLADCHAAGIDQLTTRAGGPAWDEAAWSRLQAAVRDAIAGALSVIVGQVEPIAAELADVRAALAKPAPATAADARADVRAQLDALVGRGFVTAAGAERLPDLRRYVRAMKRRLDQVATDPARDASRMREVHELQDAARKAAPAVREQVRWMIEELRVSLFAQALGTRQPISAQRVWRVLDG